MANNFADDARIIEFWRFENNLTAGKAGNDLTASAGGVGYNSAAPLEGSYSLDLEFDDGQWASRANADLSAGFPLKSGDTTKKVSWAVWLKPESIPSVISYIIAKYFSGTGTNARYSLAVLINSSGYVQIDWGHTSGHSRVQWTTEAQLVAGRSYHIGLAVDGIAKTALLRVWDVTAGTATTYTKNDWGYELFVNDKPFVVGERSNLTGTYAYDGLIDEVVVANAVLTANEFDSIRAGTFGAAPAEPLVLYGRGIGQAAGEAPSALSMSLHGGSLAIARSEATLIGLVHVFGASVSRAESEAITGKILTAYGLSESQALSELVGGLVQTAHGRSQTRSQADAYLRKLIIDCELLADPNILVRFRPHIGGGGVLTYLAGGPGVATYWDIVGIGPDCFEEPPHGSLRWHYVKADMAGLAANIYISPTDPALAGHRDRIIVRRADA